MAVTQHGSYELVRTTLIRTVGANPAKIAPDTTFGDLRLDSLALVELALALEERTGRPMPEVTEHSTLADVAELIDAAGADPSVPAARTPGPAASNV